MHARVADDHDLVDVLGGHLGLVARFLHEPVDRGQHSSLELLERLGIELGEGDTRHQIAAVHRLWIDAADGGELLAGGEVEQEPHDACRADVERHAVPVHGRVAGLDIEDALVEDGDGQDPVGIAQQGRNFAEKVERNLGAHPPSQRGQDLLDIRRLVMLLGRQACLDQPLVDARVERGLLPEDVRAGQDLVPPLRDGRNHHDRAVR